MARKSGRVSAGRSAPSRSLRVDLHVPLQGAARDVDRDAADLAGRERAQQLGHLTRDAGAHEHVVDAGEHRPEDRGRRGELDLLEAVDADDAVVALLGEPHLGEVADDRELLAGLGGVHHQLGHGLVGGVGVAATLDEVGVDHPLRHGPAREVGERPAVVAARVAVLQAAGDHGIHGGAGDDPEVAGARHLAGQAPPGDGHAHAALDDRRAGAVRCVGVGGEGLGQHSGHGCHLRRRGTYGRVGFATVSYGSVG